MNTENLITITQEEYDILLDRDARLSALECAGVDNWSGYSYAIEILNEGYEE